MRDLRLHNNQLLEVPESLGQPAEVDRPHNAWGSLQPARGAREHGAAEHPAWAVFGTTTSWESQRQLSSLQMCQRVEG